MLNKDFIPASLEAMSAALAASPLFETSGFTGLELRFPFMPSPAGEGVCGLEGTGVSEEPGVSEFASITGGCTTLGLVVAKGDGIGKLGRTLTGIITTFLKDVRKSFLSACRLTLTLAIKNDSVEASSSESFFSQPLTWA